jgi:hypothetical protein
MSLNHLISECKTRIYTEPVYQILLSYITAQEAFSSTAVHHNVRKPALIFFLLVALLTGYFTNASNVFAQQTPVFWYNGDRWDYFGFINNVRSQVNAYNNSVPGSANTVSHTNPRSIGEFFDVVIGIEGGHQVRIRMRASDLYIVGWFTQNDVYNIIGPALEAGIPADHGNYNNGERGGYWSLSDSGNYVDLERIAGGFDRTVVRYDEARVNAFGQDLWKADDPARMAAAVIFFSQFIAEAARFRGISDTIGWNGFGNRSSDNWQYSTIIDRHLVGQENSWGNLSRRFNQLLGSNSQDNQDSALTGWYQDSGGRIVSMLLITLADYARVMNTVRGYPGSN